MRTALPSSQLRSAVIRLSGYECLERRTSRGLQDVSCGTSSGTYSAFRVTKYSKDLISQTKPVQRLWDKCLRTLLHWSTLEVRRPYQRNVLHNHVLRWHTDENSEYDVLNVSYSCGDYIVLSLY